MGISDSIPVHFSLSSSSSSILDVSTVVAITVFVTLLCACIVIGHLIEENRWAMNQSLPFFWFFPGQEKAILQEHLDNIDVRNIGTIISFCLITLGVGLLFKRIGVTTLDIKDYLAIGAILSATDSVCTLQLSMAFQVGLLSAFGIKTLYFGRHSTDREVAIMMLLAYLSYMVAEVLNLSGILTVFFCGIVMSHYTWHNVTESSRCSSIEGQMPDNLSPDFSCCQLNSLWTGVGGRAAFVYPLVNILIASLKKTGQDYFQATVYHVVGRLMRGAVTIALSYNQFSDDSSSESALMITTVLLRNAKPTVSDATDSPSLEDLRLLFLENGDPVDEGSNQPVRKRSSLRLLMANPTSTAHYFWRKFDDRFMRPVFGGRGFVPFVPCSPTGAADETS
ncbi:hypothetical protein C3L33_09034, partial [Rhododendron williamsianum]